MQSLSGLIVRVERAQQPDRRLDSEVVAAVLGPPGAILDPTRYPDGYDIETAPDVNGENATWREADDVGRLTSSLEDALAFAEEARPHDAAQIAARAFRGCGPAAELSMASWAQSVARCVVVETLRSLAREGGHEATTQNLADVA